jgi:hypothetical protein
MMHDLTRGQVIRLPTNWKQLAKYTGWSLALLFFALSIYYLIASGNWQRILADTSLPGLLMATLLLMAGLGIRSLSGYISSQVLMFPLTPLQSYRYWFLSQLSKYLPGSVWQFATRSVFYQRHGLSVTLASVLTIWETLAILVSGMALSLLAPRFFIQADTGLTLISGGLGLTILLILVLFARPWQVVQSLPLIGRLANAMLRMIERTGRRRFLLLAGLLALAFAGWAFINTAFFMIVQAFPGTAHLSYFQTIVVYSVAWVAGFLVFFTPGGIGSREGVLTALLTPAIGFDLAAAIALAARLCWTGAEGVHIGLALLLNLVQNQPSDTPHTRDTETS